MNSRNPPVLGSLAAFTMIALAGCGAQESDARIGTPRTARDAACELVVIDANDTSNFSKYEQVGIVRISNAPAGTSPLAPEIRAMVRPRACALGGEAISVMGSGDATSRNGLRDTAYGAYIVWAKKGAKSATPEKF